MTEARFGAWLIGMGFAAVALAETGAWLFAAGRYPPTPPEVYSFAAGTVLYWLGYFGWRA